MKFLLLVLWVLPIAAAAQVMQLNEPEREFNKNRFEFYPVNLKTAPGIRMDVSLSATSNVLFLTLTGSGTGTGTIDKDNEVVFTLDNNSTVTAKSIGVQGFDTKDFVNIYKHTYTISPDDLEVLSRRKLRWLRKYSMSEFYDIQLDERSAENVMVSFASFWQELQNRRLLKPKASSTAPAFPGGKEVFLKFLNRNLKLRPVLNTGERLEALVQFRVGDDGSISDIKVVESAGSLFDEELLRVLKRMPRWKPASETGKQIAAVVTQPLTFYRNDSVIMIEF